MFSVDGWFNVSVYVDLVSLFTLCPNKKNMHLVNKYSYS